MQIRTSEEIAGSVEAEGSALISTNAEEPEVACTSTAAVPNVIDTGIGIVTRTRSRSKRKAKTSPNSRKRHKKKRKTIQQEKDMTIGAASDAAEAAGPPSISTKAVAEADSPCPIPIDNIEDPPGTNAAATANMDVACVPPVEKRSSRTSYRLKRTEAKKGMEKANPSASAEVTPGGSIKSAKISSTKKSHVHRTIIPHTLLRNSGKIADWDEFLKDLLNVHWVCPVNYFVHAPFSDKWQTFAKKGIQLEVPHPQMVGRRDVNCLATVIEYAGYKALIKFEKMGKGPDQYTWLSFCSHIPRPLTYSVKNEILILPVQGVEWGQPDYDFKILSKMFCEKFFGEEVQNTATISWEHEKEVRTEVERHRRRYKIGRILEVLDVEEPTRYRLGTVVSIIGDRIVVEFMSADSDREPSSGVELSMKSEFVHPLGWSHTVGAPLRDLPRIEIAMPFVSSKHFPKRPDDINIQNGMVFEFRHPTRPYEIVSGYVYQKLHCGYFVASVDTNRQDGTRLIIHVTSHVILPCGFCLRNNIPLEVPNGEKSEDFSWDLYCAKRKIAPLPLDKLPKKAPHKFVKGCKLEAAADILQPTYYGPATVTNVAEHLILVRFDGWERTREECSQWVSAFSTDIYPAGWAEMVGHSFESHAVSQCPEDSYFIVK